MGTRSLSVVASAFLGLMTTCVWAETVAVAPSVQVNKRVFDAPSNEAPFFNFTTFTDAQRRANEEFVSFALARTQDRDKAVQLTIGAGWQALIGQNDVATAARRFNQAFLLDPAASEVYRGFAAVAATRFRDYQYADQLFRIAGTLKNPAKTLAADHGRVLLMAGRFSDAKPLLEKAIEADADWAIPRANLAWVTLMLGKPTEACALSRQVKGRDMPAVEKDLDILRRRASCA